MYRAERRIWAPERRLWQPRTALALGNEASAPAGVTFPTLSDYTIATSDAIGAITSLGRGDTVALLTPMGEQSANVLGTCIEAATGRSLGELVSEAIIPDNVASPVASLLSNMINGMVEMVIETVGAMVIDLLGAALDVIPVIGALIGFVIDLISMIADAASGSDDADASEYATAKIRAIDNRNAVLNPMCDREVSFANDVQGTGRNAAEETIVTPSDMFRPVYYRIKTGGALPISWTSIIVMLCGPESGLISSDEYEAFMAEARTGRMFDKAEAGVAPLSAVPGSALPDGKRRLRVNRFHDIRAGACASDSPLIKWSKMPVSPCVFNYDNRGLFYADPGLGLKPHTRERMWKLVKAIMSGVQDPAGFIRWGDGGQSAMSLLTDILFRRHEDVARPLFGDTDGYWNDYLARAWNHRLVTAYRVSKSAVEDDQCVRATGSCRVKAHEALIKFMNNYKEGFIERFVDENGQLRRTVQRDGKLNPVRLRGLLAARERGPAARLTLGPRYVKKLMKKLASRTGGVDLSPSTAQKALLAAAGLSGSYLAYRGYKHFRRR